MVLMFWLMFTDSSGSAEVKEVPSGGEGMSRNLFRNLFGLSSQSVEPETFVCVYISGLHGGSQHGVRVSAEAHAAAGQS